MIRIYLFLILAIIIYFYYRNLRKKSPELITKYSRNGLLLALVGVFILLAVTGHLNGLFALIGVLIAFLLRAIPVLLNYAPALHKLWQNFSGGNAHSTSNHHKTRSNQGSMSAEEALDVLGLKPNASEADIIAAHRKLMQKIHPDRGGSDYLAAKINLAKKVLLNK